MSCPVFHYTFASEALFLLAGTAMGATGGGGSVLALPIFLVALGAPYETAVPATSAVVGAAALSGTLDSGAKGGVPWKRMANFALPAVAMSLMGSFLLPHLPVAPLKTVLVALLALAAWALWTPTAIRFQGPLGKLPVSGGAVGLLMGLFGIGGGFLAMPALVVGTGISVAEAVPVSLATIAATAAANLAIQIPSGNFRWGLVAPALLAAFVGMEFGAWIRSRIPEPLLRKGLAILVGLASVAFGVWIFARR